MVETNPLPAADIGKSVDELAKLGCKFVVEGEHFQGMIALLERLISEMPSDDGRAWCAQLRLLLLTSSKPVKMMRKNSATPELISMQEHITKKLS